MSKLTIAIIAAILGITTVFLTLPGDERKIKSNLSSLAQFTSSPAGESVIDTVQKTARAAKLCAAPFEVIWPARSLDRKLSVKELSDQILLVKKRASGTLYRFDHVSVDIVDKRHAEIRATLRIDGNIDDSRFADGYETQMTAEKKGKDWFFTSFRVLEFTER